MDLILENELWPNALAGSRSQHSMRILSKSKEKVLGGQETPGVHSMSHVFQQWLPARALLLVAQKTDTDQSILSGKLRAQSHLIIT